MNREVRDLVLNEDLECINGSGRAMDFLHSQRSYPSLNQGFLKYGTKIVQVLQENRVEMGHCTDRIKTEETNLGHELKDFALSDKATEL